jgi:hypothetical protein
MAPIIWETRKVVRWGAALTDASVLTARGVSPPTRIGSGSVEDARPSWATALFASVAMMCSPFGVSSLWVSSLNKRFHSYDKSGVARWLATAGCKARPPMLQYSYKESILYILYLR